MCCKIRSTAVYGAGSVRHRRIFRTIVRPRIPISLNSWCVNPYVFDFLDITERVAERELASALIRRLEQFSSNWDTGSLLSGANTISRSVIRISVWTCCSSTGCKRGSLSSSLKVGRFEPEYVEKLGFYLSWIDDNLRDKYIHAPTVGILLCAGRNDNVVRYSLAGTTAPLAVADYTYETLPSQVRDLVPADDEIAAAVEATVSELDSHLPCQTGQLRMRGAIRFRTWPTYPVVPRDRYRCFARASATEMPGPARRVERQGSSMSSRCGRIRWNRSEIRKCRRTGRIPCFRGSPSWRDVRGWPPPGHDRRWPTPWRVLVFRRD